MANSYLKTSFTITGDPQELDLLQEAIAAFDAHIDGNQTNVSQALVSALDGEAGDSSHVLMERIFPSAVATLCVTVERDVPNDLSIYGTEHVSVDELAELIRRCCPSSLPFAFTFCVDNDRPEADTLFGGYLLITTAVVTPVNGNFESEKAVTRAKSDKPLTPLIEQALHAYDDDGSIAMHLEDCITFHAAEDKFTDGTIGDTLGLFILREVADAGDDPEEAARMMESAAEQLIAVADALRSKAAG